MTSNDPQPGSIPWLRWISAIFSLALLALGIHLLSGGTTGDPRRDSPWPYLALGALLAVRALVAGRNRRDGQP